MFHRRVLAAIAAAIGLALATAPAAVARAAPTMEDHSRDAQIIATLVLLAITGLLVLTGRKRLVAKKDTEWTDAGGEKHAVKRGWIVPRGTTVSRDDAHEKRLSAFRSLYLGKDNRASTSKAIALAWTYALAYGLVSLLMAKLLGSDQAWDKQIDKGLQEEYLLLLGGPYAAAVIAKYTAVATDGASNKTTDPQASPGKDAKNLIADDEGYTDLIDFQYVLFNLVALAFFFGNFVPDLLAAFPDLPALLVGLALTSATGYAAKKAAVSAAGPQLTSVFPQSASQGGTVEVWGRNLVHDSDKPLVSVAETAALSVDVLAATGVADRLKVTVPTTVDVGERQLKVTTSAGVEALTPSGTDHLTITVI